MLVFDVSAYIVLLTCYVLQCTYLGTHVCMHLPQRRRKIAAAEHFEPRNRLYTTTVVHTARVLAYD